MSWILTSLVNSFDDEIRGIGIRILTTYIDRHQSMSALAMASMLLGGDANTNHPETSSSTPAPGLHRKFSLFSSVKSGIGKVGETVTNTINSNLNNSALLSNQFSGKINTRIAYKLLWHRCRTHRVRLGMKTHDALIDMILVGDGEGNGIGGGRRSSIQREVITPDKVLGGGFIFDASNLFTHASAVIDDTKILRSKDVLAVVLRLLRFLTQRMKEKWLFELLTLMRVSPNSIKSIVQTNDWQSYLFTLISDIFEESKDSKLIPAVQKEQPPQPVNREETTEESGNLMDSIRNQRDSETAADEVKKYEKRDSVQKGDPNSLLREWSPDEAETLPTPPASESESSQQLPTASNHIADTSMRFDLAMKLYSMLLAHSIREGGDHAFKALESAASLQRTCVNGSDVFCAVFSHIMSDLTDNGTVVNLDELMSVARSNSDPSNAIQRNKGKAERGARSEKRGAKQRADSEQATLS